MTKKKKIKVHQPLPKTDEEADIENNADDDHDSKDDKLLQLRQKDDSNDEDEGNEES